MGRNVVESIDVVVLGTGAAALTAAITAHGHGATVGLFEKGDLVGGTSAMSGGMVWIPCNSHMEAYGYSDTRHDALRYLGSLSHDMIVPELAEAYVDGGPEMLGWLEANTPVEFEIVENFPDYHPEHPGGKTDGGRSLECPLFSFSELGDWADRVTISRQMSPHVLMNETTLGRGIVGGFEPGELERREAANERGCGQALVGRLLKGCLDRGIAPRTGHRAVELQMDGDRVGGVIFDSADGRVEVRANRAVILATGGFEHNRDLVRSFIRGPLTRTVAVETNTGDGLKMAMRVGAALGNMQEAWWVPCIDVPDDDGDSFPWMVNRERVRPRCIMVNRAGRRFANEASNYNAFGAAFHQLDPGSFEYKNLPAYMVFDQEYASRWGVYTFRGEGEVPDWLVCSDTLDGLAARLEVDPDGLVDTVARWNAISADLDDPEFGRGRSVNDIHWGDSQSHGPEATLGPIDSAPFYGVQVHPGALGTKGGPRTTVDAQVLDLDGIPINGLYAAGNVMASAMGMTYGGAGGTLGPGMVFGFLAGRHGAQGTTQ